MHKVSMLNGFNTPLNLTKDENVTVTSIPPINGIFLEEIQHIIDQKTKPLGSLGQLEDIAVQLAQIQSKDLASPTKKINIKRPTMIVFSADHGISDEGVSIAPSAVTRQMVQNFIAGGAAINCFCRSNDIEFSVVDAGIVDPIEETHPVLINQRIGAGTKNFANEPAMTETQLEQCLLLGEKASRKFIEKGCNFLLLGEMGIGNTSSASAILAALTGQPLAKCVGLGTGITAQQLTKKCLLIERALQRLSDNQPLTVLQEVGGFEIAQMVGAIIGAAKAGVAVLIDGFIVTAAALLAVKIVPNTRDYLLFSHQSSESGHQLLLEALNAKPLLNIGLRLGEGTGAALALPLINASASFYNDMASFESAGVTV